MENTTPYNSTNDVGASDTAEQLIDFDPSKSFTKVTFCGGLHEVGKNMACIEADDELYIIDCGMKMLKYDEYGYRIILPSFDYVIEHRKKVMGIIITHGHEDHIGAIPYLLTHFPKTTIYLPRLAREILLRKLKEFRNVNINDLNLVLIDENFVLQTRQFEFSFFITVHSIPDSFGVIAKNTNGTVVFSGDFRVDFTPLGRITEFHKLTALQNNCDLFLSDSTNSLVSTFSISERVIISNIEKIFIKTKGRMIVTAFASNVFRVQNIIRLAIKYKRKICIVGRSMKNIVNIALRNKYFDFGDSRSLFINVNVVNKQNPSQVIILCTGSQGESLAALTRMSEMKHKSLKILSTDTIIFSSNAIPGNYWQVQMTVNNLQKFGAKIIQSTSAMPIHTSGHASREEQKLFLALLKPNAFIPIHGELNMLVEHIKTAIQMGVPAKNTFVCQNGSSVVLQNHHVKRLPNLRNLFCTYVDGNNLIPENRNRPILSSRRILIRAGIIFAIIAVNFQQWKLSANVVVIVRGTFYSKNNLHIIFNLQRSLTRMMRDFFQKARPPNIADTKLIMQICEFTSKFSKQFIYKVKKINPYIRSLVLIESSPNTN